jgi:hypothetical protein
MATKQTIVNVLGRGTTALEIDHHQVNHAPNTVSVHVNEIGGNDNPTGNGQDIDGVTVEDLGSTGEIARAINNDVLVSFVQKTTGLPTRVAVPPAPPQTEEAPAAASVPADGAP